MSLPWELRSRGLKDSLRHDERVKDAIRKNLRELISEEAIITSDGTKTVKIPLRYLDQYRFIYGHPPTGVGQGEGNVGDIIAQRGDSDNPSDIGLPGEVAGEETYEVEVPLEEIVQMMLEDLALPWLEEKPLQHIKSQSIDFTDVRRKGPIANLDKRRTLRNNIIRNAAKGNPRIENINEDDLRFKVWNDHENTHANAAVYLLMDRSGSMTTHKKYVAKSFFFWMVHFLRSKYRHVDPIFIAHDVDAAVVPEKNFFTISNSGGTLCSSAYNVALEHIEKHHPPNNWNVYVFHFSDGDNFPTDNERCKYLVEMLLQLCTMVGYGEINSDDDHFYAWRANVAGGLSSLQETLQTIQNSRFMSVNISRKADLYEVLQTFLQPQNTTKDA